MTDLINPQFNQGMVDKQTVVFYPDGSMDVHLKNEIDRPVGWWEWHIHDPNFRPPWDAANTSGWCEPEGKMNSYRGSPVPSYMLFTRWRIHWAGLSQRVYVGAGNTVRFSIRVHAWSSSDDNPETSDGCGDFPFFAYEGEVADGPNHDALINAKFRVGINLPAEEHPHPESPDTVWGRAAHVYNEFHEIEVEAVATDDYVTLIVEGKTRYRLSHNDMYYDDARIEVTPPQPVESCHPREDFHCVYALIPPEHGFEWFKVLEPAWEAHRFTVGASADHAAYIPGVSKRTVLALNPESWPGDLPDFFNAYYPNTSECVLEYVPIYADTPKEWLEGVQAYYNPFPDPDPGGGEYNYPVLAVGSKLFPHAVGEAGTYDMLQWLSAYGYTLPYVKIAAAKENNLIEAANFKALSPGTQMIVRLQEIGGDRWIEAPDFYSDDPEAYMAQIIPLMRQYPQVAYWELFNEPDPPTLNGHVQMALFAVDCMTIAERYGFKLALPAYSTGVPEPAEWEAIWDNTDFFQRLKAGGHILSLHAYGSVSNPTDLEYHILRPLHQLYEAILIPNDCVVPYVLTEWNINNGPLPIDEWLTELAGIDAVLAEQYFCLGIAVFTFGAADAWPRHDMSRYWQQVANLIYDTRHRENALPPNGGNTEPPELEAIPYCQRDTAWASKRLLPSSATMGGSGCVVTSVAMKATEYDRAVTPGTLCDSLVANNGFTSTGGLYLAVVTTCLPWLQFQRYYTWRDAGQVADLSVVAAMLEKGSTIIQVDFDPSDEDLDTHFVYVAGWTDASHTDLIIIDPWTGATTTLLTKYSRGTLDASIKALIDYEIVTAPKPTQTLLGFNDHPGPNGTASDWLRAH